MDELAKFKKTITLLIFLLAALTAAVALILGYKSGAKGFVLGSFFSWFNFLLMARQTPKRLGKGERAAKVDSGIGMGLRMLVMAVPIYIAFQTPDFDVVWTIAGIFNLQISVVIYSVLTERLARTSGQALE